MKPITTIAVYPCQHRDLWFALFTLDIWEYGTLVRALIQ